MKHIMSFFEHVNNTSYGEWPMNRQQQNMDDGEISSDPVYAASDNKFDEIQNYMKIILKPTILKKNPNAEDSDIEKIAESFFKLGNNKSQEIKQIVDGCKNTKQCAQEIIDKYLKYVKINFNTKDDTNDVEQKPLGDGS